MTPAGGGLTILIATTMMANTTSMLLSARNVRRPMPKPICRVTLGARNFNGASKNEIASTMPSHTKVTATANADPRSPGSSFQREVGQTPIRFDERVQSVDGDRCFPAFQGPLHEP